MSADRLEELAAGSVAGGLDKKERREFEKLIRAASPAEKAQVAAVLNAGALATLAIPQSKPSPRLLQKLMPIVMKDARAPDAKAPSESLKFVRAGRRTDWIPLPVPGASFKLLSMDDQKDYAVILGKLDPGASYPAHKHLGPEETFVLSGDLSIGEVKLGAGDFHLATAGSHHGVNRSENGCVVLQIISKKDLAAQMAVR